MSKFRRHEQCIIFLTLMFLSISCTDKFVDLNPLLIENIQKLKKEEFLAKAYYSEVLFYNNELFSETHGEGYLLSAGSHYPIQNSSISFFPTQLELQKRNYFAIQNALSYTYEAVPEITSSIDIQPDFKSITNSLARVLNSGLLNLDLTAKELEFISTLEENDETLIKFKQKKSASGYPFKGAYTLSNKGTLSKIVLNDFNCYSHLFWEFLKDFNFSNFTIYFQEEREKLTISKAVISYNKNGYEHNIEMIFENYKDVEVDFLNAYYSPIVINEVNPYIFKINDKNVSEAHRLRESNYYFMDTDSMKHTQRQSIDTLILTEIINYLENEKH